MITFGDIFLCIGVISLSYAIIIVLIRKVSK